MVTGEGREDPLLNPARVLIFIDQHMVKPTRFGQPDFFVSREEFVHEEE